MPWAGFPLVAVHRVFLVSPICLLTLVCLWSSESFRLTHSPHESLAQEAPCPSCSDASKPSFVHLPSSSAYIKEVLLRKNRLTVQDSRREYASVTQPVTKLTFDDRSADGSASDVHLGELITGEIHDALRARAASNVGDMQNDGNYDSHSRDTDLQERQHGVLTKGKVSPSLESPAISKASTLSFKKTLNDSSYEGVPASDERSYDKLNAAEVDGGDSVSVNGSDTLAFLMNGLSKDEKDGALEVQRLLHVLKRTTPGFAQGQGQRSFRKRIEEKGSCHGRKVYIYNLPSKFNVDLLQQCDTLLPWFDFCEYFTNEGLGRIVSEAEHFKDGEEVLVAHGAWHETHQYALELVFHARLKHYPCLTTNVGEASLFYVPYYGGLDVIRWHFRGNLSVQIRDSLTMELLSWLGEHESWKRHGGKDHLLVLGKISWDFRRPADNSRWGSNLLNLGEMYSPTKLLIERNPWHENDVAVPHPTFFHPRSDDDIHEWIDHVNRSERTSLVSFAGMPRPNQQESIRSHLIEQCLSSSADCYLLRCENNLCLHPKSTVQLFLHSHYCMQPPGDSPTRRSVFDSIIAGCIPVLFDPYTAYFQYPWHLPEDPKSYSVYIPSRDVMNGVADVVQILKSISPEQRTQMRQRILLDVIPGLLYSRPGSKISSFRDAFDISMERLLQRVSHV